jgi:hypothetical protein
MFHVSFLFMPPYMGVSQMILPYSANLCIGLIQVLFYSLLSTNALWKYSAIIAAKYPLTLYLLIRFGKDPDTYPLIPNTYCYYDLITNYMNNK